MTTFSVKWPRFRVKWPRKGDVGTTEKWCWDHGYWWTTGIDGPRVWWTTAPVDGPLHPLMKPVDEPLHPSMNHCTTAPVDAPLHPSMLHATSIHATCYTRPCYTVVHPSMHHRGPPWSNSGQPVVQQWWKNPKVCMHVRGHPYWYTHGAGTVGHGTMLPLLLPVPRMEVVSQARLRIEE